MAIQTYGSANPLTNSLKVQYTATYLKAVMANRLYDQFAMPYTTLMPGLSMEELMRSTTITFPFLSRMEPGTAAIPETSDVSPSVLKDENASITHTSRYGALEWSEALDIRNFTNYAAERLAVLGQNQIETVDLVAQAAALKGAWVHRYGAVARSSLDAGTSTHRASDALFSKMDGYLQNARVPSYVGPDGQVQVWGAMMHPYPFSDIRESGNVDSIGTYQDAGIHLNWELGKIGSFRLMSNALAKVFWAAGAANTSAIATTLASAAEALHGACDNVTGTPDHPLVVTANTNIDVGDWLLIGTIETGATHYATNEYVMVAYVSGTDVGIIGSGENGGLAYAHAAGATVSNADPVYPILFGGPNSLVKLFATNVGEFGQVVGPAEDGLLNQFRYVGWKWYGGYSRYLENRLLRAEVSSSYEA